MALNIPATQNPAQEMILRIGDAFQLDPDRVSLREVRQALAGHNPEFPATRAMALLFASDFPNKHRDFEALLDDETLPSELSNLAATYLGRLQTPEAVDVLTDHLDVRDGVVLTSILRALGVAGDRRALEAITELDRNLPPSAANEADVAAALIAYRLGIEGHELPLPADLRFLDVDSACAARLEITPAGRNDVEFCLRSLGRRPYGVELAEKPAFQVRCQQHAYVILLNRAFAASGAIATAIRYKAILGVVAIRARETGLYVPAYVLLAAPVPAEGNIRILACRAKGQVIFGGEARLDGTRVHFSFRATARPGAFGLIIEATLEDGSLRPHRALTSLAPQAHRRRPVIELAPAE